jgi:hypothetical protein
MNCPRLAVHRCIRLFTSRCRPAKTTVAVISPGCDRLGGEKHGRNLTSVLAAQKEARMTAMGVLRRARRRRRRPAFDRLIADSNRSLRKRNRSLDGSRSRFRILKNHQAETRSEIRRLRPFGLERAPAPSPTRHRNWSSSTRRSRISASRASPRSPITTSPG